jgi:hypothetical protein
MARTLGLVFFSLLAAVSVLPFLTDREFEIEGVTIPKLDEFQAQAKVSRPLKGEIIQVPDPDITEDQMKMPPARTSASKSLGNPLVVVVDNKASSYFPLTEALGQKVQLPSMKDGGLMLFFHIPKTGGTSLRTQAKKNCDFITTQNKYGFDGVEKIIMNWTDPSNGSQLDNNNNNNNNKAPKSVKFVEFHGISPSFVTLASEKLEEWRRRAAAIGLPVFVFSMMRDPVDTHLSTFNFFCVSLRKNTNCTATPDIDGLLEISRDNTQARWLCYCSTLQQYTYKTMEECGGGGSGSGGQRGGIATLHKSVVKQLDWIGRSEQYEETLVVLNDMLPVHQQFTHEINNRSPQRSKVVKKAELNQTMLSRLQNDLAVDIALYRFVETRYNISAFTLSSNQGK